MLVSCFINIYDKMCSGEMFKNNLNSQNRTFKNIRELFPHYLSDMKNAAALQMGHPRAGPVTDFF